MSTLKPERFLTDKKILIGIETKPFRDIVINMCRDKGATTIRFGNGEEMAVDIDKFNPDLVFSEFHMSPLDGVSFVRAVKTIKRSVPIVMLVSPHDEDGHGKSRRAGATVTLTMPFSLNDIVASTKKALEAGTVQSSTGLRFGPRT